MLDVDRKVLKLMRIKTFSMPNILTFLQVPSQLWLGRWPKEQEAIESALNKISLSVLSWILDVILNSHVHAKRSAPLKNTFYRWHWFNCCCYAFLLLDLIWTNKYNREMWGRDLITEEEDTGKVNKSQNNWCSFEENDDHFRDDSRKDIHRYF